MRPSTDIFLSALLYYVLLLACLCVSLSSLQLYSARTFSLRSLSARSRHLHLFLQARAILSSAVRLNLAGPYAAQRLLLVDIRQIVNKVLAEQEIRDQRQADAPAGLNENEEDGPATTWPLGEILSARHDQLHSRIFNS